MSKVATYLQQHILGEVSAQPAVLDAMSRDASVLEIKPEMVIYPKTTNDIRKVARFSWQLAEKGHVLPITARGSGTDQTGAAIGSGIVLAFPAHMNNIFEFEPKQKLVRVQPGMNAKAFNDALRLHGVTIPSFPASASYSTVGGAVANNATGTRAGRYGDMRSWVGQLEVVLANGEVLQTGRISKRELNKKKGLQTFEGEIYRSLDNLIEDNAELIVTKLSSPIRDNVGYSSLADVKHKDGSFDLTPLFIGSQGTLGIISEMIMRTEFVSLNTTTIAATFSSKETARDALDIMLRVEPAILEYIDGEIFDVAAKYGKTYDFLPEGSIANGAVVILSLDDFSERARARKVRKILRELGADTQVTVAEGEEASELLDAIEVTSYSIMPTGKDESAPPLFDGAYIPAERFEDFSRSVAVLAQRYHVALPLHGHVIDSTYSTRPILQFKKVSDKQKIFKLLDEYAGLLDQFDGHLIGQSAEGRVKARFAYEYVDDEAVSLFTSVKAIFDPFGILNTGVKQPHELKQLVAILRSNYDNASLADYLPYN